MNFFKIALICFSISVNLFSYKSDVTIMGNIKYADGLSGISYSIIDMLKDDIRVGYLPNFNLPCFDEMSQEIAQIVKNDRVEHSKVLLFTDLLWNIYQDNTKKIDKNSAYIKIAYSMLETTLIPPMWAKLLNQKFDAVVVPDDFLVEVYKKSGVHIPIFVLPCALYLDNFLAIPKKIKKNDLFKFGISAGFGEDKNHILLMEAFLQEFKNDDHVQLIMHGRGAHDNPIVQKIKDKIINENLGHKVILLNGEMSKSNYLDFMSSLDCYALLSRGEGFSITPREAMAMGIPCILSCNSAHITLCKTGFVEPVAANIITIPDYYVAFGNFEGKKFNCTIEDVRIALRRVYNNYDHYLHKAVASRNWVRQYSLVNLKTKYKMLIKPTKVILSHENSIEDDCIKTNSKKLYRKYKMLYK